MLDAMNFVTAMRELPISAAIITFLEPDAMFHYFLIMWSMFELYKRKVHKFTGFAF